MIDLTFEYWNKLATHMITISSLLGGFSIAVVANLLVSEVNTKLLKSVMASSVLAASFFIISIFSMTKIFFITTSGYPFKVEASEIIFPRIAGASSFFLGILFLLGIVALSGWTKSKNMGRFTTFFAVLTFIILLVMTS